MERAAFHWWITTLHWANSKVGILSSQSVLSAPQLRHTIPVQSKVSNICVLFFFCSRFCSCIDKSTERELLSIHLAPILNSSSRLKALWPKDAPTEKYKLKINKETLEGRHFFVETEVRLFLSSQRIMFKQRHSLGLLFLCERQQYCHHMVLLELSCKHNGLIVQSVQHKHLSNCSASLQMTFQVTKACHALFIAQMRKGV